MIKLSKLQASGQTRLCALPTVREAAMMTAEGSSLGGDDEERDLKLVSSTMSTMLYISIDDMVGDDDGGYKHLEQCRFVYKGEGDT